MKKIIISIALPILLFLSKPLNTSAQIPDLSIGERARVTSSSMYILKFGGIVTAVNEDTLEIQSVHRSYRIPYSQLDRLEISRGSKRNTAVGWLIGTGIGAFAGFLSINKEEERNCHPDEWCFDFSEYGRDMEPIAVLGSALLGGLAGGIIGALIKTERWEPIPIPGGLSLYPQPGSRVGVGFSYKINLSGNSIR